METRVWVESADVQALGEGFAVGQRVTWPMVTQLNQAALAEHVGSATAAEVAMGVDWHARRPTDTVTHTGIVQHIERYRCRHARGHVVPGTVEASPVGETDDWDPETDGVQIVGYIVTVTRWEELPD